MPYEWPPLTPGDPDEIARRIAAVLDDAWQRLADKQRAVLTQLADNSRAVHTTATLEEFKQAITDFHRRVDEEARQFVRRQLPHLYEGGARAAAESLGATFTWTLIHRDALQALAADSYADFLRRSQEAERMADRFYRAVRVAARREVPLLAAGNMTAKQAARSLAERLAAEHKLTTSSTATAPGCRYALGRRPPPSRRAPSPTTPEPSTRPARPALPWSRSSTVWTVGGPHTRTRTRPLGRCAP
ncbi:hypothetical protein [Streptomyces sp. NPDC056463]|uniref:hypothetical protein n=1 Tax=Streptomyces sp. NPDC056463 TaxID=3345827 RepID=UPI0036B11278